MEEEFEMDLFNDDIELNLEEGSLLNNSIDIPEEDVQTGDDDQEEDVDLLDDNKTGEDQDDSGTVADEDSDDDEGDQNDSPNLFSSVATVLKEQGLLPSLGTDSKIETVDDLATAFVKERESLVKETLVEKFGEDGYDYIVNGVPIERYEEYKNSQTALDSITEDTLTEDLELSKKVIYQDYINQGMSEKRATSILEKIASLGDEAIIEDAITSLSNVKDFNKETIEQEKIQLQKDAEAQEKIRQENDLKLKNTVYSTEGLIEGQKLTKAFQDQVYKSMTTIVGKSPEGYDENNLMRARREDPINFDTKLYYIYELTKGFTDFSSLTNSGKSSAVKDLEKAMQNNSAFSTSGQPSFVKDKDSYSTDIGDELV